MASELPRFIVLKSKRNGRYLCPVVAGDGQAETNGSLHFSGENVLGLSAKYEVEAADNGLVHIRSCYNNKYWARLAEDEYRIVAQAKEPEIDSSKWSCTLFKPVIDGDARTVRFGHVQLNGHVSVIPSFDIAVSLTETGVEFEFMDWKLLVVLPRHVAFKANNGCYLGLSRTRYNCFPRFSWNNGHNYMQFTGNNIRDPTVRNDIDVTADGYVRIKSHCHNSFWRRDPKTNRIRVDSNTNEPVADGLFLPVKIGEEEIALRSKANDLLCERCNNNHLRASAVNATTNACLLVEETVLLRSIQIEKCHPGIRRSCRNVELYVSDEIINRSTGSATATLTFSYSNNQSRSLSSSVLWKLGGQASFNVTIPPGPKLQFGISGEISKRIQRGEREEILSKIDATKSVTVPPKTAIKVIVTGLKDTMEVPFSYTQSDTLTDGRTVTIRNEHGIYIQGKILEFKQSIEERNIEA